MVDSSIGGNWNSSGVDSSRISISITLSNGVDGSMVHIRDGGYRADSRVGGNRADRSNRSYNIVDSSNMVDSSIGGNWNSSGVDSSRISISITLSNGVNNRGSVQAIVGGVG